MRRLATPLFVLVMFLAMPSTAMASDENASTYFIGSHVRLNHPFYGCPTQEALDKVKAMFRARDLNAMIVAAKRGECSNLDMGARGVVTDHSVLHASTCMRIIGDPDCVWVPDAVVASDQ